MDKINSLLENNDTPKANKLKALLNLCNFAWGDSITNTLITEIILYELDMSIQQLALIYTENPSEYFKIRVTNPKSYKTIEDESRLTEPANI